MRALPLFCLTLALGCSAASTREDSPFTPGGGGSDGGGFNLSDGDPGGFGDVDPTTLDPDKDNDGDGYLFADDCNDGNPLVNPGAYDVPGDGVDNDCNGTVDDVDECEASLAMTSTNAMDFARALGLCRIAKGGATGKDKTWGVVSAKLTTTDGAALPAARQFGIQSAWGSAVKPRGGKNMVVLSTGSARTPGQSSYMKPLDLFATNTPNASTPPAGWPRNTTGCPAPSGKTANDSVVLKLVLRVPTNANSFTFDFDFYTSEYIEFSCSPYNDTYVAILKSKAPLDPKFGGNISFDTKGNPINVNSDFFQVCTPGTSTTGGLKYSCPLGRGELKGTGYDDGTGDKQHGATSWLQTRANVLPGEEIELSFMIWNTSDHILQSAVLLDNFKWLAEGTTAPVTDRPK